MAFKSKPQLTGPDYLIGAAERLQAGVPFAQEFQDMIITAISPSLIPGMYFSRPTEWAAKRELNEDEEGAARVFAEAIRVALLRRDREAVQELSGWGAAMLLRFHGYMEQRNFAPDDGKES
jgi:hypothetical protein